MLFSDRPRTHYPNAPVHEVICQLRFPTILTINNVEPADFQVALTLEIWAIYLVISSVIYLVAEDAVREMLMRQEEVRIFMPLSE